MPMLPLIWQCDLEIEVLNGRQSDPVADQPAEKHSASFDKNQVQPSLC